MSSTFKLIKSKATGRYLSSDGGWTREVECARRFQDFFEVMECCRLLKLDDAEIAIEFQRCPTKTRPPTRSGGSGNPFGFGDAAHC
jgi:hypothetical protein